jgi:broad specificity phosphatase PhoE
MKQLYLIRHGETDWNVQERFQGHTDIPLNDTGRSQARQLIAVCRHHKIEAILSSDLKRALETAQIIASQLDIKIFQDSGLREANLGKAQGLTYAEIEKQFGKNLIERWRSPHLTDADISYPSGESGTTIMQRSFTALRKFLTTYPYSKVAVTTHGGVIRRIMQKLLPAGSPPVPIPNGVVHPLLFHPEQGNFIIPELFT